MCIKSAKIKWLQKFLQPDNAVWKNTLYALCNIDNLSLFIRSNYDVNNLPDDLPLYYKDSFKYWKEVKNESVNVKLDLNQQFIWYNVNIKVKNNIVYSKRLLSCGMWHINDLYCNGMLIQFDVWQSRGAQMCDYLLWQGIINAIPNNWKILVTNDIYVPSTIESCTMMYNGSTIELVTANEKHFKCFFRNIKKCKENGVKAKAKHSDLHKIRDVEWSEIYRNPFDILVDNKIIDMQFKILHRIIGTNSLLYKMKKETSPNCCFCNMYPESIEHLFFKCMNVKNFWFNLFDIVNRKVDSNTVPTCKSVILCMDTDDQLLKNILNIICLYGKMYIYSCKLQSVTLNVNNFEMYIVRKLSHICQSKIKLKNVYNFVKSIFEN